MGHFDMTYKGRGKNKQQAEADARGKLHHEYGYSHSITETIEEKLLGKVPPDKEVRTEQLGLLDWYGRREKIVYISMQPDLDAPEEEWLEEWEFTWDVHA